MLNRAFALVCACFTFVSAVGAQEPRTPARAKADERSFRVQNIQVGIVLIGVPKSDQVSIARRKSEPDECDPRIKELSQKQQQGLQFLTDKQVERYREEVRAKRWWCITGVNHQVANGEPGLLEVGQDYRDGAGGSTFVGVSSRVCAITGDGEKIRVRWQILLGELHSSPKTTFTKIDVSGGATIPNGKSMLLNCGSLVLDASRWNPIPVLNDIPFVGEYFKTTESFKQSYAVKIMVTPRVVVEEK